MLAVYGAGGFALQMLDTIEAIRDAGEAVCFVDDGAADEFHGFPVVRPEGVGDRVRYAVLIAKPSVRRHVADGLDRFETLTASGAMVSRNAEVGEGGVFAHYAVVEADVRIGRHFHCNVYGFVAHECTIGDFVTFGPRVTCNGNVTIGDMAYIGAGAVIRNGSKEKPLAIGEGAVVGMGAIVTCDVPPGAIVVGTPARSNMAS